MTKKKTAAQLDKEIAAALARPSDQFTPDELALIQSIRTNRKVRSNPLEVRAALSKRADTMRFASHGDEARWIKKMADALSPAPRVPRESAAAAPARTSAATFSVMLQLPDDPRFAVPGMTLPPMYGPAATGLQRDEAVVIAKRTQEDTGRHVRVYVDGRNYDTADFGPRPVGYKPRSITAKILPGVPMAR